jgi:hypothetical protein
MNDKLNGEQIDGDVSKSLPKSGNGPQSRADRAARRRAAFLSGARSGTIEEDEPAAFEHPEALRDERYTELPINALSRQTLIYSDHASLQSLDPSAGNARNSCLAAWFNCDNFFAKFGPIGPKIGKKRANLMIFSHGQVLPIRIFFSGPPNRMIPGLMYTQNRFATFHN